MILNNLKNPQKNLAVPFFGDLTLKPNRQFIIGTLYKSRCEIFTARREVRLEQSGINENSSEERGEARITKQYPYHCSVWGVSYRCGATEKRKLTPDNEQAYICGRRPHVTLWYLTLMKYQCSPRLNCTTLSWDKISLLVPINLFYLIKLVIE